MNAMNWKLAGLALTVLGMAAPTTGAGGDDEGARYTFRHPPVNSMGVRGMAELRGKPVLIDFWGTR